MILAAQHLRRFALDKKAWGKLKSMGFCVDDPRAWVAPTRRQLDLRGVLSKTLCYVGKGSREHTLPASKWSGLLQSSPGLNRSQALEQYERAARADTASMESVVGLEGLHLTCHGQPSQRCHADVLIRLFLTLNITRLCDLTAPPP